MKRKRLLFSNVPVDCSDDDLKRWVEEQGYRVRNVTFIRDYVSGTSPCFAYVELVESEKCSEAVRILSGQIFRGQVIWAGESLH